MKFLLIALLALLAPCFALAAENGTRADKSLGAASAAVTIKTPEAHIAQLDAYAAHLESLLPLVNACAATRNSTVCDPSKVGPDDEVVLPSGEHRIIRFGWLRTLLEKAQRPDPAQPNPKDAAKKQTESVPGSQNIRNNQKPEKTDDNNSADSDDEDKPPVPGENLKLALQPRQSLTSELLKSASDRLSSDLQKARQYFAAKPDPHTREHAALKQVLSESAFRNLNTNTPRNRILEKLSAWINSFFEKINSFGSSAPWLGKALLIGFFVVVGVALIWSLIQSERRLRLRLTPEGGFVPGAGAASARDWQLWLKDAEAAAAAGEWREAIHFIYWASISRLESLRLWPADRARTPREYLALVKSDDPRRPGLQNLTRSFERTWYGGRMAEENEYNAASEIAKNLIQAGGKR